MLVGFVYAVEARVGTVHTVEGCICDVDESVYLQKQYRSKIRLKKTITSHFGIAMPFASTMKFNKVLRASSIFNFVCKEMLMSKLLSMFILYMLGLIWYDR